MNREQCMKGLEQEKAFCLAVAMVAAWIYDLQRSLERPELYSEAERTRLIGWPETHAAIRVAIDARISVGFLQEVRNELIRRYR